MVRISLALALCGCVEGTACQDCDSLPSSQRGPFATSASTDFSYQGHPITLHYPTDASPTGSWPGVVMMHGMTLGYEWYARHLEHWSSHGFIVAFPFVKSVAKDDRIIPVTETDATSIYAALGFLNGLSNGSIAAPSELQGKVNMESIGLVGHSMGGEDTIRAAAAVRVPAGYSPLPKGTLKVAVAQHPSLCTFPPPYPYTINKAEINAASNNAPLFLFTAENDRAFLPGTPKKEHKCWQAANGTSGFASFRKSVCESYPSCKSMKAKGCSLKIDVVGKGHMCACDAPGLDTWTSPELKWVTSLLRLYLHHDGDQTGTTCGTQIWEAGDDSLQEDPNVATVELHGPVASTATLV